MNRTSVIIGYVLWFLNGVLIDGIQSGAGEKPYQGEGLAVLKNTMGEGVTRQAGWKTLRIRWRLQSNATCRSNVLIGCDILFLTLCGDQGRKG